MQGDVPHSPELVISDRGWNLMKRPVHLNSVTGHVPGVALDANRRTERRIGFKVSGSTDLSGNKVAWLAERARPSPDCARRIRRGETGTQALPPASLANPQD